MSETTNEMKHTPGPWEVRPDRYEPQRGWREIHAGRKAVVRVDSFDRRSGGETETHCGVWISEENAQLIAAAPRMLAALQRFERWDTDPHATEADAADLRQEIHAAIAEAISS